jgi:hypothetical protein
MNEALYVVGHSFERAWSKLEWLLEGERWKEVGSGFGDVNDFLATVQLPKGADMDQRKSIAKRIKELQPEASQRKIAGALGVSHTQVQNDLRDGKKLPPDPRESSDDAAPGAESGKKLPPTQRANEGEEAAKLARKREERKQRDKMAEERRIEEARERARAQPIQATVDIRHGDFREVLADLRDLDVVLTDPPYGKSHLPLLADLAAWADTVLKPDGVLGVLMGQANLPEVYRLLDGHRRYRWTACLLTEGPGYVAHASEVQCGWKPILIYGGGPRFADVFRSEGLDVAAKVHHRWGQDFAAFEALVERLSEPGQTIVDPFMGSGTTLLAAQVLGRHAIGADVDAASVATAEERLSDRVA